MLTGCVFIIIFHVTTNNCQCTHKVMSVHGGLLLISIQGKQWTFFLFHVTIVVIEPVDRVSDLTTLFSLDEKFPSLFLVTTLSHGTKKPVKTPIDLTILTRYMRNSTPICTRKNSICTRIK